MSGAVLVDSAGTLAEACARLREQPVIGIDTEFERTRTFYARCALIQISDGSSAWLVDPLAIDDLGALGELLACPQNLKVLHACSEDLEVLERSTGARPAPLFDTQVGAAFAGHGYSLSYRALVGELLGLELAKDATRSDWLKRPLSPRQLDYAARDAIHLVAMHSALATELGSLHRTAWCEEECARLARSAGMAPDPERYYLRVPGARDLAPRELARLRALGAWREREARARDRARRHVAEDAVLLAIARAGPADRSALEQIQGLARRTRERHGDAMLAAVAEGDAAPAHALPEPLSRLDPRELSRRAKSLRGLVRARAEELGIAPELLLQRRLVEALLEHVASAGEHRLPEELTGWRRAVIAEDALGALRAAP